MFVSNIVKRVVSHIIPNVCLQHERKHICWRDVVNLTLNEQCDSDCSLLFDASSKFVDI